MKKIISTLTIGIIIVIALPFVCMAQDEIGKTVRRANSQASIVEKGKTWWYYDTQVYYEPMHAEYGLTIGDKSDYDDGSWSEVVFEKAYIYTDRYQDNQDVKYATIKEEKIKGVVALIKEQDGVLLTKRVENNLVGDETTAISVASVARVGANALIGDDWTAMPVSSIYAFGNVGDTFKFGNEQISCDLKITDIKTEEYAGGLYSVYTAEPIGNEDDVFSYRKLIYTREFGVTEFGFGSFAFYAPYALLKADGRWQGPTLRYVTDPDHNVIYTREPGPKIWEAGFQNGITDVTIDSENNDEPVYYNLQGIRINNPDKGQVVIKRQGTKITKITAK